MDLFITFFTYVLIPIAGFGLIAFLFRLFVILFGLLKK